MWVKDESEKAWHFRDLAGMRRAKSRDVLSVCGKKIAAAETRTEQPEVTCSKCEKELTKRVSP